VTLIHASKQGTSRAKEKSFDMTCEMCIVFCSLFAYMKRPFHYHMEKMDC